MKLTPRIMKKIETFAREKVKKNDPFHGIRHMENTAKFAVMLAKKEGADVRVCRAAALLHDIEKYKERVHNSVSNAIGHETRRKRRKDVNHGTLAARTADSFLRKLKVDGDIIKKICQAIYFHNKGDRRRILEAKIIYDADKIQGLGPAGFARAIAYWSSVGKYDLDMAMKIAQDEQKFFFSRLFTKTARSIVRKELRITDAFYRSYMKYKKV